MRYMGGKSRIAKYIAAEINKVRKPGQLVWDAFCGGLSITFALSKHGPVLATDANAALINLYKAVQNGWEPPTEVSKETWVAAKSLPDTDPMKAYAALACGFGGDLNGGYVANKTTFRMNSGPRAGELVHNRRHYATALSLMKCRQVKEFQCSNFLTSEPCTSDLVLYCDAPYSGCYGYGCDFDYRLYIDKLRFWSNFVDVFVSEYELPIGNLVWERPVKVGQFARNKRTERLYHLPKGSTW